MIIAKRPRRYAQQGRQVVHWPLRRFSWCASIRLRSASPGSPGHSIHHYRDLDTLKAFLPGSGSDLPVTFPGHFTIAVAITFWLFLPITARGLGRCTAGRSCNLTLTLTVLGGLLYCADIAQVAEVRLQPNDGEKRKGGVAHLTQQQRSLRCILAQYPHH